jgi:hypothetical protein
VTEIGPKPRYTLEEIRERLAKLCLFRCPHHGFIDGGHYSREREWAVEDGCPLLCADEEECGQEVERVDLALAAFPEPDDCDDRMVRRSLLLSPEEDRALPEFVASLQRGEVLDGPMADMVIDALCCASRKFLAFPESAQGDRELDAGEWACDSCGKIAPAESEGWEQTPRDDAGVSVERCPNCRLRPEVADCGCPLPAMVRDDGTCSGCGAQVAQPVPAPVDLGEGDDWPEIQALDEAIGAARASVRRLECSLREDEARLRATQRQPDPQEGAGEATKRLSIAQLEDLAAQAARAAWPVFDLQNWKWGHGDDAHVPVEDEIAQRVYHLLADARGKPDRTIGSGRFEVAVFLQDGVETATVHLLIGDADAGDGGDRG